MPRPRTVDDEAVLDAAAGLVIRLGPAKLTLQRVAEEVGLSAATLVQRFGSKRGLLLAMGEQAASGWPERFEAARARADSPLAALVDALTEMTAGVRTPEAMANSVALLQMDLADPEFHARTAVSMRRLRALIASLLEEAVAAGELSAATDTASLADSVLNAYNGALVSWAIFREQALEVWLRRELERVLEPDLSWSARRRP